MKFKERLVFALVGRLAAIAIEERMDSYGAEMKSRRLLQQVVFEFSPGGQIFGQGMELRSNLIERHPDVQVAGANFARPLPHVAEHFPVQLEHPRNVESCGPTRGPAGKIFQRGLQDVVGLRGVKLRSRRDSFDSQTGNIVDRRFARQRSL